MVNLPFSVPRIKSIDVKTRNDGGLVKFEYVTLHVCTPKCCQVQMLGKGGKNTKFGAGKLANIPWDELGKCAGFKLENLTAVRLTHGRVRCYKKKEECENERNVKGWHGQYLTFKLDDWGKINCNLHNRLVYEQQDVVDWCHGPWIKTLESLHDREQLLSPHPADPQQFHPQHPPHPPHPPHPFPMANTHIPG